MKAYMGNNPEFGYDCLIIEAGGHVYKYRGYGHMDKDGDPNYSSDRWTAEEREIAEILSVHINANKKSLEEDIEYLSKTFSRAGVNYSGTRTGSRDASRLDEARETLRNLDKAEALLASSSTKLDIAALVGYVESASEVDKKFLTRTINETNPKGLVELVALRRKIPQRHMVAFDELCQLVMEEAE